MLKKTKSWILVFYILLLFTIIMMLMVKIEYINKQEQYVKELEKEITIAKEELSLENSIGYWFINTPDELNDSILYEFLIENKVWYPDILLKQAKIESGNYASNVYKKTNNVYGMRRVCKRQTTQLDIVYNGYGCYNNWCLSVLDRILWDIDYFNNKKPTRDEYLRAMSIYAQDPEYINKIK